MKPNKAIAIVQARLGSTRLPNKVLASINEHPMLWHLINRLRKSKRIDQVVVAIPNTERDRKIVTFCHRENIACFQGSEHDVLDRFYRAATAYQADTIVRITADCPLIDPGIADDVVDLFLQTETDYASNTEPPTYPDGLDVEVFSYSALQKAHREASKRYQREHVTSYITEHSDLFTRANYIAPRDLSHWHLTVDEPEDLQLVQHIYAALGTSDNVFSFEQIVAFLDDHPDLLAINAHKKRNEAYDTQDI